MFLRSLKVFKCKEPNVIYSNYGESHGQHVQLHWMEWNEREENSWRRRPELDRGTTRLIEKAALLNGRLLY